MARLFPLTSKHQSAALTGSVEMPKAPFRAEVCEVDEGQHRSPVGNLALEAEVCCQINLKEGSLHGEQSSLRS